MIIELIGPKGVGKSTVAPLVADRLGIRHYMGQAFHELDGTRLGPTEEWADRALSVLRAPFLFAAAWRVRGGSGKERLRFAFNTARRDRFAARAASDEDGILESGPLNSLFQASASYGKDVSGLHSRIVRSDIYVRLRAVTEVTTRRLELRGGVSEGRVAVHGDWVDRYERVADRVLPGIGRPVLEVDATGSPDGIAESIAAAIGSHEKNESLEHRQ